MNKIETISIKTYLLQKGINFLDKHNELITHCLFNNCDIDSKANEGHLYFNEDTSQYHCKKCGEKGNIFTLAEFWGDDKHIVIKSDKIYKSKTSKAKKKSITNKETEKYHIDLLQSEKILEYLNNRGITDEIIKEYQLGWGFFYNSYWITIPVKNSDGKISYLKLRKNPLSKNNNSPKFLYYPENIQSEIFNQEIIDSQDYVVICEGEFDCMLLNSKGISSITSTSGAGTFKKEWIERLNDLGKIYICLDNDEAGKKGTDRLIEALKSLKNTGVYQITLPQMQEGKDITDFFIKYNGKERELFDKYCKYVAGKKPIDTSKFKEITSNDLINTLGLTIKHDNENKLVAFFCMLSAYTEDNQFNISFNAPSSTGKSYIPTEISKLFPKKDVIELGYCSPTAFFHDIGNYIKSKKGYFIDLSRKIIVFLDQPHNDLLARLRPLLSHDEKEIHLKITDKTQRAGTKTKDIFIKGFPSVIFCSAGLKIDEQEATRFILLSPETSQEKIRNSIQEKIKKETDNKAYANWLRNNPERILLKERIEAVKEANIQDIKIPDNKMIEKIFFRNKDILKSRHQRDIGRFMSLIKAFALINLWFRDNNKKIITATEKDVLQAKKIWDIISESQEYNLPPYIFNVFKDVIIPCFRERNFNTQANIGISRRDICIKYNKVYGKLIIDWQLRQQIIPMLEASGLITQEKAPNDKRNILIYPNMEI
jgi:DNA primase